MSFEKIENAIAFYGYGEHHTLTVEDAKDISEAMRLLLDVARAADALPRDFIEADAADIEDGLDKALTALKEHCE